MSGKTMRRPGFRVASDRDTQIFVRESRCGASEITAIPLPVRKTSDPDPNSGGHPSSGRGATWIWTTPEPALSRVRSAIHISMDGMVAVLSFAPGTLLRLTVQLFDHRDVPFGLVAQRVAEGEPGGIRLANLHIDSACALA